jgi:hypothetical protein
MIFSIGRSGCVLRMSQNRMRRLIFGIKREEVKEDWRKLRKEEIHKLCSSVYVREIQSRRMRWEEHVARMECEKCMLSFSRKT